MITLAEVQKHYRAMAMDDVIMGTIKPALMAYPLSSYALSVKDALREWENSCIIAREEQKPC